MKYTLQAGISTPWQAPQVLAGDYEGKDDPTGHARLVIDGHVFYVFLEIHDYTVKAQIVMNDKLVVAEELWSFEEE